MERKYHLFLISAVVLLLIAGGLYWLNNQNNPKVQTATTNSADSQSNSQPNSEGDVKSATDYDPNLLIQDAPEGASKYFVTGGEATYTANKKFLKKSKEVVVGETTKIKGMGWFNPQNDSGSLYIEMNVEDFSSGNPGRDKDVPNVFNDPTIIVTANFSQLKIAEGISTEISIPLDVMLNGVQKKVIFNTNISLSDDEIMASGKSEIKLSDFNIKPPSLLNVFEVEDKIELSFDIKADSVK